MSKNDINFPEIDEIAWRSPWPYLVTLKDGKRLAAYPMKGKVVETLGLIVGQASGEQIPLWLVSDNLVEHPLIDTAGNNRIISPQSVVSWEAL